MPSTSLRLGFYYHIPIKRCNGCISVPAYLGVFLDSIANEVGYLILFMHEANLSEKINCDYNLLNSNIEWINLGFKKPAWYRDLFHGLILRRFRNDFSKLDVLILRAPTPFGPYIHHYIDKTKLIYLLVGSYGDGAANYKIRGLRDWVITKYLKINNKRFEKSLSQSNILVNSLELYNYYREYTQNISLVRTTTLTEHDFYLRDDCCEKDIINLLYTGRIDPSKGLNELIESVKQLNDSGIKKFNLTIVGWDTDIHNKNLCELKDLVNRLKLEKYIFFVGKKKVGVELNSYYRSADIYTFPSYFEGFPRTIWEAMANSLPIVTTPVGGIPHVLENGLSAVFCKVRNVDSISEGVSKLVSDINLRKVIIGNAYLLASQNTLERQSKVLVQATLKFLDNKNRNN